MTQLSAGTASDVLQLPYVNANEFTMQGLILPLNDAISTGKLQIAEIPIQLMQAVGQEQVCYGLPSGINCGALYYNRDLFAQYGVDEPDDSWTWDDYFAAARRLTLDTDGDGATDLWGSADLVGDIGVDIGFDRMIYERGGRLWNDEGTAAVFDSDVGLEVFQLYQDLSREGIVPPQTVVSSNTTGRDVFENRMVAMVIHNAVRAPIYEQTCSFSFGMCLMPNGNRFRAIWTQPTSLYCISSKTPYMDEACRLLDFLVNDPAAYESLRLSRGVPANRTIAEALRPGHNDAEQQMQRVTDLAGSLSGEIEREPFPPAYMEYYNIIKREREAMLFGEKSPEKALHDAQEEVNQILTRFYQ